MGFKVLISSFDATMDSLNQNISPGLPLAFHGTVIHSLDLNTLEILDNCFILVNQSGKIQVLQADVEPNLINEILAHHGFAPDVFPVKRLPRGQFLCKFFPIDNTANRSC